MVKTEEKKTYDIFQHDLVPKHRILPKKEVAGILEKYHIQPFQLPYVKASDPAANDLKAQPGEVIEITRKSPTAGETVVYRYVIEE